MSGMLKRRSSRIAPPQSTSAQQQQQQQRVSHRRGQTLVLTHPSSSYHTPVEHMDEYAEEMEPLKEPLWDDAFMSHISVDFARMRPSDFQLPKYEFYSEPVNEDAKTWEEIPEEIEAVVYDELTAHQTTEVLDDDEEDVAVTIHFTYPGKPRVIHVSPPPSIRSGRSLSTASRSGHHSRSSSYSVESSPTERMSIDDSSATSGSQPNTPASMYSDASSNPFAAAYDISQPPKNPKRYQKAKQTGKRS